MLTGGWSCGSGNPPTLATADSRASAEFRARIALLLAMVFWFCAGIDTSARRTQATHVPRGSFEGPWTGAMLARSPGG